MIQIIGAILVGLWFFRSARVGGQDRMAWVLMGICAYLGPSLLLNSLLTAVFFPSGIPADRIGSGVVAALLVGIAYNLLGLVTAWTLHKNASRIQMRPHVIGNVVLPGTYLLAALLQAKFTGPPYSDIQVLNWLVVVDAIAFAFLIRRKRGVLLTVIIWSLYCGARGVPWIWSITSPVEFQGLAGRIFLQSAIASAIPMLGVTLALRMRHMSWLRFLGIVAASYTLRVALWAVYSRCYQTNMQDPLTDLVLLVVGVAAFSIPVYWALWRTGDHGPQEWYVLPKGEKKIGPMRISELKRYLDDYASSDAIRIRKVGQEDWLSIGKAVQIFDELSIVSGETEDRQTPLERNNTKAELKEIQARWETPGNHPDPLECPQCSQVYLVGFDSALTSTASVYDSVDGYIQMGRRASNSNHAPFNDPVLVGYRDDSEQLRRSRIIAKEVHGRLLGGEKQFWYCYYCGNSKRPYEFPSPWRIPRVF